MVGWPGGTAAIGRGGAGAREAFPVAGGGLTKGADYQTNDA